MKVCSFEIAKLLHDNNIEIPSIHAYTIDDIYYFPLGYDCEFHAKPGELIKFYDHCYYSFLSSMNDVYNRMIMAPCYIDILNWLCLNKHTYVSIIWLSYCDKNNERSCVYNIKYNDIEKPYNDSSKVFNNYEDAIEAAIIEILK